MNDSDSEVEQANGRVRPWVIGLLAVIAVGYGGFTVTRNGGWAIAFSLLLLVGGLVVVVGVVRQLTSGRRTCR